MMCGPLNDIKTRPGPNNEFCNLDPELCIGCAGGRCPPWPPPELREQCISLGVSGPCLDRRVFSQLETARYAFNAPKEMLISEPQTMALVIDTTGKTEFSAELLSLPGSAVQGETPISLIMEAEIVGPAFEITPSGRQRRQLSKLNPTRWDWGVTPKRSGKHQLEVSLFVIVSRDRSIIGEDKALAERHFITVSVPPLRSIGIFVSKLDPILTFLIAIGGAFSAILAWFGFKGWSDANSGKGDKDK